MGIMPERVEDPGEGTLFASVAGYDSESVGSEFIQQTFLPHMRRKKMAIYVSFLKKTAEGNKDIKKARERYQMGKQSVAKVGGKILAEYYIVARGEYLVISEFPDEQARVKSMVNTVQRGTVNYEVYRVLPVEDFFKLVDEA
jgi:uncharacterized protein with GYD domain